MRTCSTSLALRNTAEGMYGSPRRLGQTERRLAVLVLASRRRGRSPRVGRLGAGGIAVRQTRTHGVRAAVSGRCGQRRFASPRERSPSMKSASKTHAHRSQSSRPNATPDHQHQPSQQHDRNNDRHLPPRRGGPLAHAQRRAHVAPSGRISKLHTNAPSMRAHLQPRANLVRRPASTESTDECNPRIASPAVTFPNNGSQTDLHLTVPPRRQPGCRVNGVQHAVTPDG